MLYDKQTRSFCLRLLCIGALLILLAAALCYFQAQQAKSLLLDYDRAVISSLLERGVAEADIAAALKSPAETEHGAALAAELGRSEDMGISLFPHIRRFFTRSLLAALPVAALILALAAWTAWGYLTGRERLYVSAARTVDKLLEGDFSVHLSRSGEGSLFALFAKTDALAMALQSRSEAERRARESLKDAVSDISHQLKTPLAALSMYNEIILSAPEDAEAVSDFARKSRVSLSRMESLIQALLRIMRLDAGSVVFRPESCAVSELAERAVDELRVRAELEGKSLTLEGDREARLMCDPQWTAEALSNLVKNALDHTGEGASIRLSWERSPAMLRITVADDGEGIDPEDMHFIFKRFYRSRRGSATQGAGLGLPLAKTIVEAQGGSLSVKSQPGQGAAFTVSFLTKA